MQKTSKILLTKTISADEIIRKNQIKKFLLSLNGVKSFVNDFISQKLVNLNLLKTYRS